MAKRFGMWERVKRSTYSADAYRDVAADRVGSLLGYLAVLIAIATVITTISTHVRMSQFLEELKPWLIESVPDLRIIGGTLSSPVEQPYIWDHEDFQFVLDTTGTVTEVDPTYAQGVLLTETTLIYRQVGGERREYDLSDFPDMVINDATWDRWIDAFKSWLWLVVAITTVVLLWCVKLLNALCGSLIGLAVATLTKRPLRYGALFNLSIYALTVPLAFDVLIGVLGWSSGVLGLISMALYGGYLGWGLFVQPPTSVTPSVQTPSGEILSGSSS